MVYARPSTPVSGGQPYCSTMELGGLDREGCTPPDPDEFYSLFAEASDSGVKLTLHSVCNWQWGIYGANVYSLTPSGIDMLISSIDVGVVGASVDVARPIMLSVASGQLPPQNFTIPANTLAKGQSCCVTQPVALSGGLLLLEGQPAFFRWFAEVVDTNELESYIHLKALKP